MMKLEIKLFGTLGSKVRDYDPAENLCVHVPPGCTPADILRELELPLSHVGLITGDNRPLRPDSVLQDGMIVSFFSLVSGG